MKSKSGQRGILFQIEGWNSQEYFVYFKDQLGQRPAERRSRFFQRFAYSISASAKNVNQQTVNIRTKFFLQSRGFGSKMGKKERGDHMRSCDISREDALRLLQQFNKEHFHLQHALTVEGVMRYYAETLGYGDEADFWATVGLLHEIDFELYPEQHCQKAPELLRAGGVGADMIHAICSHGYGICCDIAPEHEMEKVLYAVDELTGLIGAVALMRPSKSVQDLELKSVKKKFKSAGFAAGCSREVIRRGAEMLGWELDDLISRTILAMRSCEDAYEQF